MIRAVIYKDLRQQWPWLLGVSLLAVAYGAVNMVRWPATVDWWSALLPFIPNYYDNIDPTPPLVRLEGIYILASAYGIVLGLLQGLSDTRATSDFFLHRPCSRTRLAFGKLLGGTLLFWIPGLLAIALMTVWAGLGRFASPFRAWMALVPFLSWWIGYGFYLAAIHVAWRQGRWFGPRLLPAVAPILVAALALGLPSLAFVLLALVLSSFIFWLVNVHVLASREDSASGWNRGWDRVARILSGVVILVGLLAVTIFAGAIAVNLSPRDWDYHTVVFTKQGEPRIQKYDFDDTGTQIYEWLDLNGQSVGRYPVSKDIPSLSLASILNVSPYGNWAHWLVSTLRQYEGGARRHRVFWFLMANDGVVTGYAHPTGAHLGSFGPQGRLEDGSGIRFGSPRQSQGTQWSSAANMGFTFDHLFADGNSLYSFTVNPPHMSKLWQSDSGHISRLGLTYNWARNENGPIFVESDGLLTAIDATDGTQVAVVDLPAPLRDPHRYMTAGWTGEFVVVSQLCSAERSLAYAFSPTGETLHEWDVKMREPKPFVWWKSSEHLPLNLCAAPWVGIVVLILDRYEISYGMAFGLGSYWPLLLLSGVITLVSVLLARRRLAQRRSRANVIWWLIVVALFSWPGYLLCLITTRLPKHVGCPDCGRPRPPETTTCPQCRADWPLPKRTGLEILLPAHP
ncbi:MAG: hypothetical protein IH987_09745 [Planctomycetes bacterium]|nr:hypothetical protein [Planctomycetota bacterium]